MMRCLQASRTPGRALAVVFSAIFYFASYPAGAGVEPEFWAADGPVFASARLGDTVFIGGDFHYVGPNARYAALVDALNGRIQLGLPEVNGEVLSVISDGAGGWILGGAFTSVGGLQLTNAARINVDGNVDPDFDPNPNGAVRALLRSGGVVYLGGEFTAVADPAGGSIPRERLAAVRLNDGSALAWAPGVDGPVNTMALAADGSTMYLGGEFTGFHDALGGTTPRRHLAAVLLSDGALTSWDPGANAPVLTLALDGETETLYIGGQFNSTLSSPSLGDAQRDFIAAYDLNPQADRVTAWNPDANGPIRAMAIGGSTLYVGGDFTTQLSIPSIGGAARDFLAALDTITGKSTDWNPGTDGPVRELALSADGRIVWVGGEFSTASGQARNSLAALQAADGTALAWNPSAVELGSPTKPARIEALAATSELVYVGGSFTSVGGGRIRTRFAGLGPQLGQLVGRDLVLDGAVRAMFAAQDKNRVYIAGDFTVVNGKARERIAELQLDRSQIEVGAGFPDVPAPVRALTLSRDGTTIYLAGDFQSLGSLDRRYIGAVQLARRNVTAWDPGTDGLIEAMQVSPDGAYLYVGGEFETIGGATRSHIAALNLLEATDNATDWDPGANGVVRALAVSRDGTTLYVGGDFVSAPDSIGGADRSYLAAVSISPNCSSKRERLSRRQSSECTNNATPWAPEPNGPVGALLLSPDQTTIFAAGDGTGFTSVGGQSRNNLAELLVDGVGVASAWDVGVEGTVHTMTLSADGSLVYLGGDFTRVSGEESADVAALTKPKVAASPAGGAYNQAQDISLACVGAPPCATIHFTTDGAEPTLDSPVYTGAPAEISVPLPGSLNLKILAFDATGARSAVVTEKYIVEAEPPISSAFPPGSTLNIANNVPIELRCDDGGGSGCAEIFFTADGSEPSRESNVYRGPINLGRNTVLKFFAVDDAGNEEQTHHEQRYTVDLGVPRTTIFPTTRVFLTESLTLTLACSDGGGEGCAETFYMLDGSDPIRYTQPFSIQDSAMVQFYSVDKVGNVEPAGRESYVKAYGGLGAVDIWTVLFALVGIWARKIPQYRGYAGRRGAR